MAMADLTRHYATALDQHLADPLVLVPLAMLDFLCVHPFPDGNGRMSRLLTLLLLYHFDYAVGRYISLERRSQLAGLVSRAAQRQTLARLLLGCLAAGLP